METETKLEDLEKQLTEDVNPVEESVLERILAKEEEKEEAKNVVKQDVEEISEEDTGEIDTVNLGAFGGMVVKVYQTVSDKVYKLLKETKPPKWDSETTAILTDATKNYLKTQNVPMTPGWALVMTVVSVEIVRYTIDTIQIKKDA